MLGMPTRELSFRRRRALDPILALHTAPLLQLVHTQAAPASFTVAHGSLRKHKMCPWRCGDLRSHLSVCWFASQTSEKCRTKQVFESARRARPDPPAQVIGLLPRGSSMPPMTRSMAMAGGKIGDIGDRFTAGNTTVTGAYYAPTGSFFECTGRERKIGPAFITSIQSVASGKRYSELSPVKVSTDRPRRWHTDSSPAPNPRLYSFTRFGRAAPTSTVAL